MFAGIDVGSTVTKAALFKDGTLVAHVIEPNTTKLKECGLSALNKAVTIAGVTYKDIQYKVGTGYGRSTLDFVDEIVTELTCDACGAYYISPDIRTIIDIGAQDSKTIKADENGNMVDFTLNDKCAAGTGRFLEVLTKALGIPLDELGETSCRSEKPCLINNTCTVFAETEVISLLSSGMKEEDIAAGIHEAIASRVGGSAQRLGVEEKVLFVGGVAKNRGVKTSLEKFLEIEFVDIPYDCQIVGALGAAVIAYDKWKERN